MAKNISSPEDLTAGMWIFYDVDITVGRIVGGVPFNEQMIEGWIKAKHRGSDRGDQGIGGPGTR